MRGNMVGPVADMLRRAQGNTRFHMPGHKAQLDPFDMTEIERTDDLYAPSGAIREAEALAARSLGAAHTLMLTGGGTAGMLTMLLLAVPPGGKVILPRNVHHSALSAAIWGGMDAVFADDPVHAMAAHPDACAVLVTRPDYYGFCMNLPPVVEAAHRIGARVLVDEAHGAHFAWWDAPQSAGKLGADAWVDSAHKTLPALTGAAWLNLSSVMDAERARRVLRMVQTSSPPFPILASLDHARAWMDGHGRDALQGLCKRLDVLRERLVRLLGVCEEKESGAILRTSRPSAKDPTRLVLDMTARGVTGFEAQALLSQLGVDAEMADERRVVFICTVCDTDEDFERLYQAVARLPIKESVASAAMLSLPPPGERRLSLREAALGSQEAVPLSQAEGRIAAVSAGMYPPGIPLMLPGEVITAEAVETLLSLPQARRFGVENGQVICVK